MARVIHSSVCEILVIMNKPLLLVILAVMLALNSFAQSGRRVATTTRTTTVAPIQPSLTPEPELPQPTVGTAGPLMFIPESLREREIKAINSSNFRLSDFRGKVIVINLWASWCGPCRREVPEYEKVRKSYPEGGVEFVGLTTEDQRKSDQVSKFLREVTFGFRLGWADKEMARALMDGRGTIPQTLVLDAQGHIVNHWTGYSSGQSGDRLRQTIERALKGAN